MSDIDLMGMLADSLECARRDRKERNMSERLFVDQLANEIRRVDGGHSLGAGALAEALLPFLTEHDRRVAERAWDEAVEETHALGWLHDFAKSDALARNPHRAAKGDKQ